MRRHHTHISGYKKFVFAFFLLLIALFLTVLLSQKRQELRHHAAEGTATVSATPNTIVAGQSFTVSWQLPATQSTPSPLPTPVAETLAFVITGESNAGGLGSNQAATAEELAPTSAVKILNNTTLQFEDLDIGTNNLIDHSGIAPNAYHGFELQLANLVKSHAFPNNPQVYLLKTGQGGSIVSSWAVGETNWTKFLQRTAAAKTQLPSPVQWVVWYSMGINDKYARTPPDTFKTQTIAHLNKIKEELPGALIIMTQFQSISGAGPYDAYNTALAEIAASEPNVYVVDTTDAALGDIVHWSYAGLKTIASKMVIVTQNALALTPTPSVTPLVSSQPNTQLVRATLQLFRIAIPPAQDAPAPIGPKIYLNCQPTTGQPPTLPQFTGECLYATGSELLAGNYAFIIVADDGHTILGRSNQVTITQVIPTATPSVLPSPTAMAIPTQTPIPSALPSLTPTQTTKPSPLPIDGDVNMDGVIDILDYNIILTCFENKSANQSCKTALGNGKSAASASDLNHDGLVNGIDYNLFLRYLKAKKK